jgi:PAS domain-containing protein
VIAAVRDATERHAAHQAPAQVATIVESSLDAIISLTLQGTVASWEPRRQPLFGEAALAGTTTTPRDTRWTRRHGSALDVALSISPIRDAARRVVGFSALLRDVTERKVGVER